MGMQNSDFQELSRCLPSPVVAGGAGSRARVIGKRVSLSQELREVKLPELGTPLTPGGSVQMSLPLCDLLSQSPVTPFHVLSIFLDTVGFALMVPSTHRQDGL